jgi:hypothetical protein
MQLASLEIFVVNTLSWGSLLRVFQALPTKKVIILSDLESTKIPKRQMGR